MNKINISIIIIFLLAFVRFDSYSQCSTSIFANRSTIACGESILLQQTGVGGTSSDDFSAGTLSGLWQSVTSGWSFSSPCGTNPLGQQHLWFAQGSTNPREATTVPVDASCGGNICFDFKMETQSPPPCDGPDQPGEGVYLQYSINGGASWVTIHYFDPATYNFAGWNNYCYPIPVAAQTNSTQFRWSQTQISSPTYDLWGIDNINIGTCTGYITYWYGGNIPAGYTGDSITVTPTATDSVVYNIVYTDGVSDTCVDTMVLFVEMPTIIASQAPSICSGSTQLDALASIPANCNYTIELWDGGGDGWNAGGSPPQYHNMDIHINGTLSGNLTMISGSGPDIFQIAVTDGDVLETFLQNWGTNYADCGYVIKDSGGNIVRLDGLPPIAGNPPVGCNTNGNSLPEVNVTCPTTLFYSYSWQTTAGTVTGLSNPNIFNPSVTVSTTTDYVVTGYDPAHPWCIATDTVTVLANSSNITATLSGPSAVCEGDPVTLSFLPMVGLANWTLTLNINGNPSTYTLDGSGNNIATGLPLTFNPNITTTYDVVSLLDGTGCPAAVTNPSLTVTVNPLPNAGISASISVCETDPFFDLYSILNGNPDLNGVWTNSAGTILLSSFYNPATFSSDNFTYTINGISPCPNDFAIVSVINNSLPDAGQNTIHTVCQNAAAFNMYNVLNGTPQTGGNWTDAINNPVGNIFDPSTMSGGTYTYTVPGVSPCPSNSANLTVNIDPLPTAAISTLTPSICNGNNATIDFTFTGTTPFDVTYDDGSGNITQTFNNTTGSIVVTPSANTTYTIVSISDGNGCVTTVSGSVLITVTPGPDAGANGTIPVCENSPTFDLFPQLNGTPDVGGSWTENGNPVSNMFNPSAYGAGVYTLTYTIDLPPCNPVSADVIVTVNTIVDAGGNGTHTVCENSPVFNLFNHLTGSPDVGGVWTDASGIPVPNMFNPSTSGNGTFVLTYTVLGTPPCLDATATVTVIVNQLPTIAIAGTNTITQGQSTPINFTFTGNPPFTVVYDDGSGPITSPSFNSATGTVNVSPNTTTTYTLVSVTDANGCVTNANGSVLITVNQLPTVTLSGTTTICVGDNTPLDFTLVGSPNFTVDYTINGVPNSYVFNSTGSNLLNVSPAVTTTYTLVSITDGNGVVDNNVSGSVTIAVNPLPTAALSGNNTICDGLQSPLNFTLTGTADYTLTYNPGGIVVNLNGSGNDAATGNPIMVSPSATTPYSIVSVTDANNCTNTGSGSATITVNPLPTISIGGATPICAGQSSDLTFTLSGTAPYSVNYMDGGSPANVTLDAAGTVSGTPLSVSPSNTTTYTLVDVTDDNGCSATSNGNITIVVNPLPTATISGSSSICIGQSTPLDYNFTGTGPFNINYNINSVNTSAVLNNNVDSIIVSPSATTTYTLVGVTDAFCSNTANGTVIVTVNPLPSATISGGAILCADGSTAQIDIIANGTPPFNVVYSDGFNNVALNGINTPYNFQSNTAGTYTLNSITDANGCSGNISGLATVVVNPLPIANFSFMPQPADINNPTIYFTDMSSGHISGMYDYGDGITEPTILGGQLAHTYVDTGNYQVLLTVTSADGCTATVGHTIIIDPAFLIYIPTGFSPNRDGKNDVFIPIMMGVDEYNFYVYDRFGNLVFETENQLKGWNGRVNGGEFALSGHYAYAVHIVDLLGKKRNFTGSLTLIR
jgi:gliding motility-associated-like protein